MTIKIRDIWIIDRNSNDNSKIPTLYELVLILKGKMHESFLHDDVCKIKYFHNRKEGWMAIVHFEV